MFRTDELGRVKYTPENMAALNVGPNVAAKTRYVEASMGTSVEKTLQKATTYLQIYAVAKDIYLRWGTDAATASNFDDIIPAGEVRGFLVPEGETLYNLIEREAGATAIIVEK